MVTAADAAGLSGFFCYPVSAVATAADAVSATSSAVTVPDAMTVAAAIPVNGSSGFFYFPASAAVTTAVHAAANLFSVQQAPYRGLFLRMWAPL